MRNGATWATHTHAYTRVNKHVLVCINRRVARLVCAWRVGLNGKKNYQGGEGLKPDWRSSWTRGWTIIRRPLSLIFCPIGRGLENEVLANKHIQLNRKSQKRFNILNWLLDCWLDKSRRLPTSEDNCFANILTLSFAGIHTHTHTQWWRHPSHKPSHWNFAVATLLLLLLLRFWLNIRSNKHFPSRLEKDKIVAVCHKHRFKYFDKRVSSLVGLYTSEIAALLGEIEIPFLLLALQCTFSHVWRSITAGKGWGPWCEFVTWKTGMGFAFTWPKMGS